jgi:hypothetical protein
MLLENILRMGFSRVAYTSESILETGEGLVKKPTGTISILLDMLFSICGSRKEWSLRAEF